MPVFAPAQDPFFAENGLLYLDESNLESQLTQLSKAASLIETLVKEPTIDAFFETLADNDALAEQSDLGGDTLVQIYAELARVIAAAERGEDNPFSWMGAIDEETGAKDVHTRLVYATPVLDYSRLQPAKAGIEVLRTEINRLNNAYGGRVSAYVTGDPALRVEELEAVTTGIGLSMGLSPDTCHLLADHLLSLDRHGGGDYCGVDRHIVVHLRLRGGNDRNAQSRFGCLHGPADRSRSRFCDTLIAPHSRTPRCR